jgi:hypothetical protein
VNRELHQARLDEDETVFYSREVVAAAIAGTVQQLGTGRVESVAYDTAWTARLAPYYPEYGFDSAVEWLRRNQYPDGTWGGVLAQYHDRFISTLAAVVALKEAGREPRDQRRIRRGEDALWKLVSKLGHDDSDTVGFPILSTSLAEEALALGLEVPMAPVRYAGPYKKKVAALLNHPARQWRGHTLSFSLEALRHAVGRDDDVLEQNHSVGSSPAATAGYLLTQRDDRALAYLAGLAQRETSGAMAAMDPIDVFEIAWVVSHLSLAGAICPDMPVIRQALDHLWSLWSGASGTSYSSYFAITDIDDTAAAFSALQWGGYPVDVSVFSYYEMPEHFACYPGETNPSLSAHIRLIKALRAQPESAQAQLWLAKAVSALRMLDENGSFWWDKWHASPYYVNSAALPVLHGVADDLARTRLKWIMRTQNDDGGWGYLGTSTPEETAYVLEALLYWDECVECLPAGVLDAGVRYLRPRAFDAAIPPLYIAKTLFTPTHVVQSAMLGVLFRYLNRMQ